MFSPEVILNVFLEQEFTQLEVCQCMPTCSILKNIECIRHIYKKKKILCTEYNVITDSNSVVTCHDK